MRIEGSVCLITGSTSGIGTAIALRFLQHGARVALWGRNEQPVLEITSKYPNNAKFFSCELSDFPSVEATLQNTITHFGRIDILINSAGIAIENGYMISKNTPHPLDSFAHVINVNLVSTFNLTRLVAAQVMIED